MVRARLPALVIGLCCWIAQQVPGQDAGSAATYQVRDHADELKAKLRRCFDPAQRPGWKDGWRIAQEAGAAAVPLLYELSAGESKVRGRLLWIGALVLAAAGGSDDAIARVAAAQRRLEERAFAAFAVALVGASGAKETRDTFAKALAEGDEEFGIAASAFAYARYAGRAPVPSLQRLAGGDDPGVCAAALAALAEGQAPPPGIERWFKERGDEQHADLVRRAGFLGDAGRLPELASYARQAVTYAGDSEAGQATALAAALWLSRHADPQQLLRELGKQPPAWPCVVALASERRAREALREKGWLPAVPTMLTASSERKRLAVLYAAATPLERVLGEASAWLGAKEAVGPVVLTLALRGFTARAAGQSLPAAPPEAGSPSERAWLTLAFGGAVQPEPPSEPGADAELQRALHEAALNKLPPQAAAAALEGYLARAGLHAGTLRAEAWRLLVRDVLLSGSRYGSKLLRQGKATYFPRGFPAEREDFFETAFEFYEYVRRSVPELSPGSGLR